MSLKLIKFIINQFCERILNNRRVKLSLNFTFGQGSCLTSNFARPNSNKAILLQISIGSDIGILCGRVPGAGDEFFL